MLRPELTLGYLTVSTSTTSCCRSTLRGTSTCSSSTRDSILLDPANNPTTSTTHPWQRSSTTSLWHTIPALYWGGTSRPGGSSWPQEGCSGGSRTYQQCSTPGKAWCSSRCRTRRRISTGDVSSVLSWSSDSWSLGHLRSKCWPVVIAAVQKSCGSWCSCMNRGNSL